jgi:phosphohistidine phosphatase
MKMRFLRPKNNRSGQPKSRKLSSEKHCSIISYQILSNGGKMKLYLVQHARAVTEQQDPQRQLTEEGRRELQKVTEFIKPLRLSVDYLWHSEKKRAIQTAELLAEAVEIKKSKTVREGLGPNDDVASLKNELTAATGDIMIVGHLPFLNKLASLLLAERESADAVAFKNAGIVALSRSEENKWQLEWMITPEILL